MKSRTTIILTLILISGAVLVFQSQNSKVASMEKSQDLKTKLAEQRMTEKVVTAYQESAIKTNKSEMPKISAEEITSFQRTAPSEEEILNDIKTSPHTPSRTLMTFARNLAPLMEKSLASESNANILVPELTSCALNDVIAKSARALCVQDVEELSQRHPQLKNTATELRTSVAPEVKRILDTNDAFIKK